MAPIIGKPKAASGNNNVNLDKVQPWKAFLHEPKLRPFAAAETGGNGVMRLKTEKDEHGLGG